jgi:hypothetical protein
LNHLRYGVCRQALPAECRSDRDTPRSRSIHVRSRCSAAGSKKTGCPTATRPRRVTVP